MRMCKTPAMGGRAIVCKTCQNHHYIYYSCGHSHCPICQSIKREQWADKLNAELYKVPYVHTIFTLPHQLNRLAHQNESEIYSLLMKSAWKTIKVLARDSNNLGALPGMIAVLHTFGSDMKYHIHVHTLVTFGGIDEQGKWQYPKRKKKIAPYRRMCAVFRDIFLEGMQKLHQLKRLDCPFDFEELHADLSDIRWVVHNTPPTIDTSILERYLSRYINRTSISNSRLQYAKEQQKVKIIYNDYRNQKKGQPAPKTFKILDPLIAIDQFMQHVLPPYFQKSRRYGLHHPLTKKKLEIFIDERIKRNITHIRTVFEILTSLLGEEPHQCPQCGSTSFEVIALPPNKKWIHQYISLPTSRAPPNLMSISTKTSI